MNVIRSEALELRASGDIVQARQTVRAWMVDLGFGLVDQTKIITAASELARNTLDHGGGGRVQVDAVEAGGRRGGRLTFEDNGPGIADIQTALKDGYTTGKGMGLGLGGAKRLANEFSIESKPGEGTKVVIARWKLP